MHRLATVVLPADDVSDDIVVVNGMQALGRITMNNPNLKPMDSDTYDVRLAYYTKNGGSWAIGVYRKNFRNFSPCFTEPASSSTCSASASPLQPNGSIRQGKGMLLRL